MIKSRRRPISKGAHAAHFKRDSSRTHPKNMMPPMRGGYRL